MKVDYKFVLAALALISVAAIFISPAVDLEPSALRAMQMANMLFALLALGGIIVSAYLHLSPNSSAPAFDWNRVCVPMPNIVDLNCTRLC